MSACLSFDNLTVVIPTIEEDDSVIEAIQASLPCPVLVIRGRPYGEALAEGFRQAQTEYVLTMDADGQHHVRDVYTLYVAMQQYAVAMVIGDRRIEGESWLRRQGRWPINLFASAVAGRWCVDLNSGMRIVKRALALPYLVICSRGFNFNTSLTMAFLADGLPVEWAPIRVWPRQFGHSHVRPLRDGIETLWQIVRIGGAMRTRRPRAWLRRQWWWLPWREHSAWRQRRSA